MRRRSFARGVVFANVVVVGAIASAASCASSASTGASGGAGGAGASSVSSSASGIVASSGVTSSSASATSSAASSSGSASCGDGICGGGDTCATCPQDCGPCCNGASCCGDGVCEPGEDCASCAQDCKDAQGSACPRVGMFYLGWHQPAFTAVQATSAMGKPVLTIEDVIESRTEIGAPPGPVYDYAQILAQNGLEGVAAAFYYQTKTATGPYCIVHARKPGDLNYEPTHEGTYGQGPVQDCPGYAATLARQAAQLTAAGVDFVVTDQTNLSEYDAFADAIQLRPFEVALEEWRKLRASGVKTPDLAAWQRLQAPGTMVPHVLAVYDAPENDRMIARDAATGKKLFFYPDVQGVDAGLVAMVESNGGKNDILAVPMWVDRQAQGSWSFFAQCQQGALLDDGPCAQTPTASSKVGSQLAVSPSYQLGYASVPFQAPGVLGGLTLRKQFQTAFSARPQWLFLSSWNEHVAQPQPGAPAPSMGLEDDPTAADHAFVDTYGAEFSRDLEPTEAYGSLLYDLVRSCVRVYRSGASDCNQPKEPCCQGGNFSDRYAVYDGPGGEFVLYAAALGANADRSPLYACRAGANDDFFSPDPACEGTTVLGQPGLVATKKGREMLRELRRCFSGAVGHRYALGVACPSGTNQEAVLGYVR